MPTKHELYLQEQLTLDGPAVYFGHCSCRWQDRKGAVDKAGATERWQEHIRSLR